MATAADAEWKDGNVKQEQKPWMVCGDEITAGGKQICKMIPGFGPKGLSPKSKANAGVIVRSVNSHDDLLDCCKKLLEWVDNLDRITSPTKFIDAMPNNFNRQTAREVIAKAEGVAA